MAESTHRVEIVPITLLPHPNADTLSIIPVDGYQVVGKTDDWKSIPFGAYLPPDSVVDVTRPEFSWLAENVGQTTRRIKARRLRGEWSMGLMIPAPEGFNVGDDVAEFLGVTHYNPPEEHSMNTECEKPPAAKFKREKVLKTNATSYEADVAHATAQGFVLGEPTYRSEDGSVIVIPYIGSPEREYVVGQYPDYDVEAFRKYGKHVFVDGEEVIITEKIHGANGRWVFNDGVMYAGSHHYWKRQDATNLWWAALAKHPEIEAYCRSNPGDCVYGEVYGKTDLKYGKNNGEIGILVFDIMREGKWVDASSLLGIVDEHRLPLVPVVYRGPFDYDKVVAHADGPSLVPNAKNIREGIVIKPIIERWNPKCHRVNLKVVSNRYLERAK